MKFQIITSALLVLALLCFSANAQILTVYKDFDYEGTTQSFDEGFHKGYFKIGNDVISSLKIKPGYRVVLYEHGIGNGKELTLYSDTPNLSNFDFNDITSNLKVEKVTNTLAAGETLDTEQRLYSENGEYYLVIQTDGNLCVYTATNAFKWCSMAHGFEGAKLSMQTDGNLVVYDGTNESKWASKTMGYFDQKWANTNNKPVKLVLEDDGTLNLYNASGDAVWTNE
ncbi:hypothetical protein [Pontibacter oryzae]|uniref:Bulb-type lectin domain-containing protein n=1 Tax=Pontibacter oryzae TaxID=2304593 RepID=A0A399SI46_9BACT|nr:hypothetical protein [Pontibacter oryzae]RIJ42539.1 hypothetical protein D1627_01365 [Pontibacter oryzae]